MEVDKYVSVGFEVECDELCSCPRVGFVGDIYLYLYIVRQGVGSALNCGNEKGEGHSLT